MLDVPGPFYNREVSYYTPRLVCTPNALLKRCLNSISLPSKENLLRELDLLLTNLLVTMLSRC
jgi:hypothetical protein